MTTGGEATFTDTSEPGFAAVGQSVDRSAKPKRVCSASTWNGERAISMELSGPEYLARDACERHRGGRLPTMGTVGILMNEIAQLNL